jgi:hypothetical protein
VGLSLCLETCRCHCQFLLLTRMNTERYPCLMGVQAVGMILVQVVLFSLTSLVFLYFEFMTRLLREMG